MRAWPGSNGSPRGPVAYHADLNAAPDVQYDFRVGTIPASGHLWQIALRLAFNKRQAYDHEREWRAAIYQDPRAESGIDIAADLETLIGEVVAGPRANEVTQLAIKAVMEMAHVLKPLRLSEILKPPPSYP